MTPVTALGGKHALVDPIAYEVGKKNGAKLAEEYARWVEFGAAS